ncbi:UNVERIFIED_CONTAM: Retrovirus-related Pol polyprotein from transposon RE1 [Sesamum calycinum]|uniref:Retrovirus-related Pol polyprotein from transposon RE1 n=1 Tax=Sesamum calycinum TaxID=2727403 RepID=A0AAW2LA89_9LAMI
MVSMAETQATIASNNRTRTDLKSSPSIENSSLTLVSAPLTGENYLMWSRAVRFTLGAKKKLSFIDGRSVRPADNSEELNEWIRIYCMIITWILNSVSKEIVDAFIYATSARALWLELEARYGGSNGPMIYNLEKEISSISQGDMSVTTYFTKIKMLWDELICLDPLPVCTCTAHRQATDREASRQLMRFLMGLSSVYEHKRRQILLMQPRQHVQKAFAMVLQDLRTKESLAIGKLVGQLYFLDHNSFSTNTASNNTVSVNVDSYSVLHSETNDIASLWQMRLGHSSFDALTHIPSIKFKQVYKLKLRDDGTVERYKAHLVAKGYNQVAGVDYVDCFSPVAKAVTVRLFLAIASAHSWPLHQLDVNNAFLHGYLDEEIFMLPTKGYDVPRDHVCKLKRSLYGLKQDSRQWNQEFISQLLAFGFTQSSHDHCLFVMGSEDTFVAMLIYVDDVLITSPSVSLLTDVKSYLDGLFTIKDLGVARYFLGLQIARSPIGTSVIWYINDIVRDTSLMHAKSVTTPFPQHIKLSATGGAVLSDPEPYRRLVGRLLYLGFTRLDISYGVQQLSQFLQHHVRAIGMLPSMSYIT